MKSCDGFLLRVLKSARENFPFFMAKAKPFGLSTSVASLEILNYTTAFALLLYENACVIFSNFVAKEPTIL